MGSNAKPQPSQWRGLSALSYTSNRLTMTVLRERGAKIVSLLDERGIEWLLQPDSVPALATYGDSFTAPPAFGWDKMAPTIQSCICDHRLIPDHGDAWQLAWTHEGDALVVERQCLPYRLSRSVHTSRTGLRLDYELSTTVVVSLPGLWAPHPIFDARDDSPGSCCQIKFAR